MSTPPTARRPSAAQTQALVHGLLDDAAVFPPGNATVLDAVTAHRDHRASWYSDLVGPLLVRASQVPDLLAATPPGADLRVGLVADTGLTGLQAGAAGLLDQDDRVQLIQVELALPPGADPTAGTTVLMQELAFTVTTYVEVPRTGHEGALDVLAADGAERAKYRTGPRAAGAGGAGEPAPTDRELATFLRAAIDRRLPFKLTAGLHHALRTEHPGGGLEHGFLNVLAAVSCAVQGGSTRDVADVLALAGTEPVLALVAQAPAVLVRQALVSFGCCGVGEPVSDLVTLGLLSAGAPR